MFDLYIFLGLIVTGYVVGQVLERRHYQSIVSRERKFAGFPVSSSKRPIGDLGTQVRAELVEGACVISVDYFKQIAAALRQLFGGNVRSYETLVDRARREAILRLKERCPNAEQVINLRIETSSITKGRGDQIGAVEVHAYATALYVETA